MLSKSSQMSAARSVGVAASACAVSAAWPSANRAHIRFKSSACTPFSLVLSPVQVT